jgi:hypothetical protein
MKTASTVVSGVGCILAVIGISLIGNSGYGAPPIPAGFFFSVLLMMSGTAGIASGVSLSLHKDVKVKYPHILQGVIGGLILALGIRTFILHPLELSNCPCSSGFYGPSCIECACSVHGSCDEGGDGTGVCSCDVGWDGENCDVCSRTFEGDKCNVCKRNWFGSKCDSCAPGYVGSNCEICHENWISESDDYGRLCRTCKPGFFGGHCTLCQSCTTHDDLAVCRDNVWHDTNVYTGDTCTSTGQVCSNKYDCSSFNCKGMCVDGDETSGQVCESDLECQFGTCQYRTCCGEQRHGNGECECNRVGFWGPVCDPCPGFDLVYSASICTGHGTCAAAYTGGGVDEVYSHLQCECNKEGLEPFPTWSGNTCGCLKDASDSTSCSRCASGFYSSECLSCPGGGGISQCNKHGLCSDGVSGDGKCTCDIDIKPFGLGGWSGGSCKECFSSDFFGDRCEVCPSTVGVQCTSSVSVEIPGTGICLSSCGTQTCNSNGFCV